MAWVDRSLQMKETFGGLRVKATLLEKGGDAKGAEALRAKAMTVATEVEVNNLGYALLAEGKVDEAIALFQKNIADHPDSWNAYDSLGEAFGVKGDRPQAALYYQKALDKVKLEDQRVRIREAIARFQ